MVGRTFVTATTWWSAGMDREAKERPRPSREFKLMNELDWTRSTIRFLGPDTICKSMRQIRELRRERISIFSSIRLGPMIPYCPPVYIIRCLCCCSLYTLYDTFSYLEMVESKQSKKHGQERDQQKVKRKERKWRGEEEGSFLSYRGDEWAHKMKKI